MTHPVAPVYPRNVPAYHPQGSLAENTTIHKTLQKAMKDWHKDTNMNKALVEQCVSLPPQEHHEIYQTTLVGNQNGRCGYTFNYFTENMVFATR